MILHSESQTFRRRRKVFFKWRTIDLKKQNKQKTQNMTEESLRHISKWSLPVCRDMSQFCSCCSTYFHADASICTERLFRACGSGIRQSTGQSWRLCQWNLFMPLQCICLTFTLCPSASVMTPTYASLS